MKGLAAISFILLSMCLSAQWRFDYLSVDNGLSQNSVNDIFQDREGYLWFATQDGLNRYDGYSFFIYKTNSQPSTVGNFQWGIYQDNFDNIWTASDKGATRLNWKTGKYTHFTLGNPTSSRSNRNQVTRIFSYQDKIIISFMANRAFLINPDMYMDSTHVTLSEEFRMNKPARVTDEPIVNVISYDSTEYFLSTKGLYFKDRYLKLPSGHGLDNFRLEALSVNHGFYLGTKEGLLYFDFRSEEWKPIDCVNSPTSDITWDQNQKHIWVATDNGIFIVDPNTQRCTDHIVTNSSYGSLTNNKVNALLKSNDGRLWVGTSNGGLNIYDPRKRQFNFYSKEQQLPEKPIWSIYRYENLIFLGTDEGLYVGNIIDQRLENIKLIDEDPLEGLRIMAISKYLDSFIIGSYDGKIIQLNSQFEIQKVIQLDELEDHEHAVTSIQVKDSIIWVSTYNGLFRFRPNLSSYTFLSVHNNPKVKTNYYLCSFMSKDGTLWLGSNIGVTTISPQGDIRVFEFDASRPNESPASNFVSGFYEAQDGHIWMSTYGGGVSIYDRSNQTFSHLNTHDGLINNRCSSIQGGRGCVFVSTDTGISRIDVNSKIIENYTQEDGLISKEFCLGSSFKIGDYFYFGNINGLTIMNQSDLVGQKTPKKPSITGLNINYLPESLSRIQNGRIVFSPHDKIYSLDFASINSRNKDQLSYQYRMIGFDEGWVVPKVNERRATYSLKPGNYEFQVKTTLNSLESEILEIPITIRPYFYQTWWFMTLSAAAILFLTVTISRFYSSQKLKGKLRQLELQQKIQRERERISRDLHDNVGSQMTYIASTINNMSQKETSEDLKELGEYTQDTIRQLRETIWVINKDEVTLEELQTKTVDFLSTILKNHDEISHEVAFGGNINKLNPTSAINIFRIIQEAVNNIVKHAEATKIEIRGILKEGGIIEIKDNGIGFNGEDKAGSYGLYNMRRRALELGGKLKLISSRDEGTTISITEFEIRQMT